MNNDEQLLANFTMGDSQYAETPNAKKSPEQKVREFYEAFAESDDQFDQGVSYGIMRTLDMLGIKLEGVKS